MASDGTKGMRKKAGYGLSFVVALVGCAHTDRPFPLREPLWRDSDMAPVRVACRADPTRKDPHHVACTPKPEPAPLIWDGLDNLVFRPLSESLAIVPTTEAVDVNSMDEVPDSSWFTNRIGAHPITQDELAMGPCRPEQILDGTSAPDGSWIIDKGKENGATQGFRVNIPGKGKYLFKADDPGQPEHGSAAQTVGLRIYHAFGYFVPCDQIVYFRPSVLKIAPGLTWKHNFQADSPFTQKDVDAVLKGASKRGELVRMEASSWLPGVALGGFAYQGTRKDDPNDVIPHEHRRELRGKRIVDAWLDRFDERRGNTFDAWIADGPSSDASPGHVVHYSMDTSESFGDEYAFPEITRRLGYSYIWDWGDVGTDFVTLGVRTNVWDRIHKTPGAENFVYANVRDFVPDRWKNEYSLGAFDRMTERDAAWAARILARFTPDMVKSLASMAEFTKPQETAFLEYLLEGRLERILERYLTRLSSIADVRLEGSELCGVDLAEWRGLRALEAFRYTARLVTRGGWLTVTRPSEGRVCVRLPHVALDGGVPDDDPSRYVRVRVADGVSPGPLVAHLYDLGPSRGFRLVGLERPVS